MLPHTARMPPQHFFRNFFCLALYASGGTWANNNRLVAWSAFVVITLPCEQRRKGPTAPDSRGGMVLRA